jgi:hypothetical protein
MTAPRAGGHPAAASSLRPRALARAGRSVVRATLFAAVFTSVLAGRASRALAADFPVDASVRVTGPACPIAPLSVPAFVDSLRVELAGRPRAPGTTRVALLIEPCDTATNRVRVDVTNDAGAAGAGRDVDLEDIAVEARPRALALAVAELVRGAEASATPPPPPVAPSPPPPAPAPRAYKPGAAADALVAFFPNSGTVLWGGRLSGTVDAGRLSAAVFGEAAAGDHGYPEGDVALQSFGGGLVLGPRFVRGRLTFAPALVGALAWARIQGHASAPGVAMGAGSDLTAALRARVAASAIFVRFVSVRVFLEGGVMVRRFDSTVDGARAAGLSGATFVAGVGLGL